MMKTIKYIILLFALHTFCTGVSAQNASSDILVTLEGITDMYHDIDEGSERNDIFQTHIRQSVTLNNWKADTLSVALENVSFLNCLVPDFFFTDLTVRSSNTGEMLEHTFDGETLVIYGLENCKEIEIDYYYRSDYGIKCNEEVELYFTPVLSDWHSWYFTSDLMVINNIIFVNEDERIGLFTNYITEDPSNENLTFFLINKDYYDMRTKDINGIKFNVYNCKGWVSDTTAVHNSGAEKLYVSFRTDTLVNDSLIRARESLLEKITSRLDSIIELPDNYSVNIIEGILEFTTSEDDKFSWGQTFYSEDNSSTLAIDISSWKITTIAHELTHALLPKFNVQKSDRFRFFLGESLIEYIAVWALYEDEEKRDAIFDDYYQTFQKRDSEFTSIADLESNSVSFESGEGSSYTIYEFTPYIIHMFAKEIGVDNFNGLIKQITKESMDKSEITFSDFEKVMLASPYVSPDQWNDFLRQLGY